MKIRLTKLLLVLATLGCFTSLFASKVRVAPPANYKVKNVNLTGIIDNDNSKFHVDFVIEAKEALNLTIVSGEIVETASSVEKEDNSFFSFGKDKSAEIIFSNGGYIFSCDKEGTYKVSFDFSAKVSEQKKMKYCMFNLLSGISRKVNIETSLKDIEVKITGALNLEKKEKEGGKAVSFAGFLPPEGRFIAHWRPHIEDEDAELVSTVKANTISEVLPGTVKLSSIFSYKVIQGKLSEMKFCFSPELSILNVNGQNIQDWQVDKGEKVNTLNVKLSKEYETDYVLTVMAEKILPDFPCSFSQPAITPEDVLRLDGFLAFGTNRAIKVIIDKVEGMNQVDNRAFPVGQIVKTRVPERSLFTYQFSGADYSLKVKADNIMPSYLVDLNYLVNFKDEEMLLRANVNIDIKDAPLRELVIKYDDTLTVNKIDGAQVLQDDYELFEKDNEKWLKIPFRQNSIGKSSFNIYFEKNLKGSSNLSIPRIYIKDAKTVRGFLLLSAGKGLLIQAANMTNLRKVHPGSAPIREPGLQLAYRFKSQLWSGDIVIQRKKVNIVSEIFHIASVGEGSIYGSSVFSYHIAGAPVDKIQFAIDPTMKNLEFTGMDIVDWKKVGTKEDQEIWQLNLREKILGDFSLLATYEIALPEDKSSCKLGNISTVEADAENGFIVISSLRNLNITDKKLAESVQAIDQTELPKEYRTMINNPRMKVLKAYRCSKTPHTAEVVIGAYEAEKMLDIVVDYTDINTVLDRNGEAVTVVQFRVKNSSHQFLTMKLPAKAKLWSVKVDNEKVRLSSTGDKILIPIPRHQDINLPISVSVSYAQKYGDLGSSKSIDMKAPALDVESMFAKWVVKIPDNYGIKGFDGNLTTQQRVDDDRSGITGMLSRVMRWLSNGRVVAIVFPWIFVTLAGIIAIWSWGRGKLKIFLTVLALSLLVIGSISGLAVIDRIDDIIPQVKPFHFHSIEFTKRFTLPNDQLNVKLNIRDIESYSFGDAGTMLTSIIVAIVLFGAAIVLKGRFKKSLAAAFGTSFLIAAGAQWFTFNVLGAFFGVILMPFLFTIVIWFALINKYRKIAAAAVIFAMFLIPSDLLAATNINDVNYQIQVKEKSVNVVADYKISADAATEFVLLNPPAIITGELPENDNLEIKRIGEKYFLKVKEKGKYNLKLEFLLPLVKEDSNIVVNFPLPVCRKNKIKISTDLEKMEIKSENAVSFISKFNGNICSAEASYVPGQSTLFTLSPMERKVKQEKTQFFANVDGISNFSSGFVEINYVVDLQIAQGESSKFEMEIPKNMRVTAVEAQDLGTWKYIPENNMLEILLAQPHHGSYRINVTTQIANCTLPYKAELSSLVIKDAVRQHGSIGLFCDQSMQVIVDKVTGFNRINNGDFTKCSELSGVSLKKAYRYRTSPSKLEVSVTAVKPELRVTEKTIINLEEDRTRLVSDFNVEIIKSGIFSLVLDLPKGFEIDKLRGKNIQHWDEITDGDEHKIIINFSRRILGNTSIYVEVSKMGKMIDSSLVIPRIKVVGAKKNTGDLSIIVERGIRFEVKKRQRLEPKAAAFASNRTSYGNSVHQFVIHRPDWMLKASLEVADPWIQVESLQKGKIIDGAIEYDVIFNYSIENAGVKRFKILMPEGAGTPEFSGIGITGFSNIKDNLWEVELNQKIGRTYKLAVKYRQPYESTADIVIKPVVSADTELQKGYLTIFTESSQQVKLKSKEGEINNFDPRKIPASFNAGHLSNAVLCFRTIGQKYSLTLDTIRHKVAETLKAEIESVNVISVVSIEGRIITKTTVVINNGNETFMDIKLPVGSSVLSVFVDNQPVSIVKENNKTMVPLKSSVSSDKRQSVEITYSLQTPSDWKKTLQRYFGPAFKLPLRNVTWNLCLPQTMNYMNFEGNMDYLDETFPSRLAASIDEYDSRNKQIISTNLKQAKGWLNKGNILYSQGRQEEALEAFNNALILSDNDKELNSDIQGQWIQAQRAQSVTAFASRRGYNKNRMKMQQNDSINNAPNKPEVEQLKSVEIRKLQAISDKIFMQQKAAATVAHPLRVTLPETGKILRFERAQQTTEFAPLAVSFQAEDVYKWEGQSSAIAILVFGSLFTLLYLIFGYGFIKLSPAPAVKSEEKVQELPEEEDNNSQEELVLEEQNDEDKEEE